MFGFRLLYKYAKGAGDSAQSVYLLAGWTKARPSPCRVSVVTIIPF